MLKTDSVAGSWDPSTECREDTQEPFPSTNECMWESLWHKGLLGFKPQKSAVITTRRVGVCEGAKQRLIRGPERVRAERPQDLGCGSWC